MIDKELLEAVGEALTVADCAEVKISADVGRELVKDRLYLTDCACVCCPAKLMGTIRLRATDIAQLIECGKDTEKTEEGEEKASEVIHINTMKYVM